jgi:uncharacterized protein (DUF1501 family)
VVAAGATGVPRWLLQAAASPLPADERVLVVLQLTGGNDGLNTVVPYADDAYARERFATRIRPQEALRLDDYLGLHPALAGLHRLYDAGHLAIVQGVGYPEPNRSHFASLDIWHTARDEGAAGSRPTGWIGRLCDAAAAAAADAPALTALHLGSEAQPLALAGLHAHVPTIGSLADYRLVDGGDDALRRQLTELMRWPTPDDDETLAHIGGAADAAVETLDRVERAASRTTGAADYPASGLAQKLHGVARLIDARLGARVYYVTLDGFDTHSQQAPAHAALLTELSAAVAAFFADLAALGHDRRVTLACFSEFGRRVRENASRGTDHGAAAPVLVLGGAVHGGLYGPHPSLTDLVDGDLQFHTDFRSVYATLLEDWLGSPSQPLLGQPFPKLPFLANNI